MNTFQEFLFYKIKSSLFYNEEKINAKKENDELKKVKYLEKSQN